MNEIKTEKPIGIVNASYFHQHFSLQRYYPCSTLAEIVEHYWHVTWQLPEEQSYTQAVIPHPNTHLTFINKGSHIQGICQSKYSHTMNGNGEVLGVKFKPAGFYPLANKAKVAMPSLVNNVMDIAKFFSLKQKVELIEQSLLNCDNKEEKLTTLESILMAEPWNPDKQISLVNQIVNTIEQNKAIMSVSTLCELFNIENRALQRLFNKYVGVSAKWIINRYRIHDALTQIETNKQFNWTELAIDLGYYDQAHFIKDFKTLIGATPKQHQRAVMIIP